MATRISVTVRNEQDEVLELDSTEPVLHLDVPAGRYLITVRCTGSDTPSDEVHVVRGRLH